MRKRFAVLFVAFGLLAAAGLGYQVTERVRLGAAVEGITYISSGPWAGQVALIDGWNVYLHDPSRGNYEKAFSVAGAGFLAPPRGIAYLSQGEFAGDFLLSDNLDLDTLYLFDSTGALVGPVQAQGYLWRSPEGLVQITSGPYQGRVALFHRGLSANNSSPHIYILRLEKNGSEIRAFLEKDVANQLKPGLGIAFLPADSPDPAFRNMFAVTAGPDGGEMSVEVYDAEGVLKASSPCGKDAEGLTYISAGAFSGRLLLADRRLLQSAYRRADGSGAAPATFPAVGLGLYGAANIAWLEDRGQFHVIAWDGSFGNMPGYLISRSAPLAWHLDEPFPLTDFWYTRSLTEMTSDGTYKLFGMINASRYAVARLDASFRRLGTTPLPNSYAGKRFPCLVYVPGDSPDGDRYVAPMNQTIYSFNPLFDSGAATIDLAGSVTNVIQRLCYDRAARRYYVLDGAWLRVFKANWDPIDAFDLRDASPGGFAGLAKITAGDLRGQVAVVSGDDNELIVINFEFEIAGDLLQRLIDDVEAAGLDKGRANSLVQKLRNAKRSAEGQKAIPAMNQIEAFRSEVNAQIGKDVTAALAEKWMTLSEDILRGLRELQ